jgi:hypothetical protein
MDIRKLSLITVLIGGLVFLSGCIGTSQCPQQSPVLSVTPVTAPVVQQQPVQQVPVQQVPAQQQVTAQPVVVQTAPAAVPTAVPEAPIQEVTPSEPSPRVIQVETTTPETRTQPAQPTVILIKDERSANRDDYRNHDAYWRENYGKVKPYKDQNSDSCSYNTIHEEQYWSDGMHASLGSNIMPFEIANGDYQWSGGEISSDRWYVQRMMSGGKQVCTLSSRITLPNAPSGMDACVSVNGGENAYASNFVLMRYGGSWQLSASLIGFDGVIIADAKNQQPQLYGGNPSTITLPDYVQKMDSGDSFILTLVAD